MITCQILFMLIYFWMWLRWSLNECKRTPSCCFRSGGSHQSKPPARPDAPATLHEELHPAGSLWGQWTAAHEPRPPRWPLHFLPHHAHQDCPPMVTSLSFFSFCFPAHSFLLHIKSMKRRGALKYVFHVVHSEYVLNSLWSNEVVWIFCHLTVNG